MRWIWYRLSIILRWEGADVLMLVRFYLAIVQAFLLFGAEIWVLTPRIRKVLGGFHHQVSLRITGKQHRKKTDGIWH